MRTFAAVRIFLVTASLLLSGILSSAMAETTKEQLLSSALIPTLRLDMPTWQPLSDKQIKAIFLDRQLEFDEDYEPVPGAKVGIRFYGGCPTIETFFADGTWQMYFCSIGPMTFHGRWTVEPHGQVGWLCVQSDEWPSGCRTVWQGSTANRIIMQLSGPDAKKNWGRDGAYNPYRLVPAVK
ncbi:hypothetical protein [Novosphingobium sp. UBA1939]|jgi:hypothetical protein|uniref:hypothetical protein n=1 Tax=Novosphingobium sp. UBA1939 TaxID=1946982 RepID=UPI0025EAC69B|nr:hypothetical protein [Novosphingobium sp. UBA1939]